MLGTVYLFDIVMWYKRSLFRQNAKFVPLIIVSPKIKIIKTCKIDPVYGWYVFSSAVWRRNRAYSLQV